MTSKGQLSVWAFLAIIVLIGVLFLYPVVESKEIIVKVSGTEREPKLDFVNIETTKKPVIYLFSKSNPFGDFELNLVLLNEQNQQLLSAEINEVGIGRSVYPLKGELKGNITIEAILTQNNGVTLGSYKEKIKIE